MSLYRSLLAKRDALQEEGRSIALAAQAAGGWAQSQRDRDDEIAAQLNDLNGDIAREERHRSVEASAPGAPDTGVQPKPDPSPFASFGQFLQAVVKSSTPGSQIDPGLLAIQAATGASEAVGSDGGYLVQKDISNELLGMVHDTGVLSSRANRIPIGASSNGITINVVDESSRANGSRWGGVQAFWASEAAAYTASRPKVKPMSMTLGKLIGLYYATDELIQDASAMQSVVTRAFVEEFGFKLDDAMIRGTGAGIPLGILNAPGTVTVSKETGQTADTLVADNVEKMFIRMSPRSRANASWFINTELFPQIWQLHHVIGTSGVPLFVPPGGLVTAPNGLLLGRPIEDIEQCSAIGDLGDIVFGDFGQYDIIEKGGIRADSSIHVQFLTDEMTFRWTLRTMGQPHWPTAVTPYKGSNTVSPFVTLEAR